MGGQAHSHARPTPTHIPSTLGLTRSARRRHACAISSAEASTLHGTFWRMQTCGGTAGQDRCKATGRGLAGERRLAGAWCAHLEPTPTLRAVGARARGTASLLAGRFLIDGGQEHLDVAWAQDLCGVALTERIIQHQLRARRAVHHAQPRWVLLDSVGGNRSLRTGPARLGDAHSHAGRRKGGPGRVHPLRFERRSRVGVAGHRDGGGRM